MNKKAVLSISITLGVIGLIMIFFTCVSLYINEQNKKKFDGSVYVVIYQYDVKDFNIDTSSKPSILYKELFTSDLFYENKILSKTGEYNNVLISGGIIKVTSSSCRDHLCESFVIRADNLLNNTDIVCMPNGLIITLEVNNENWVKRYMLFIWRRC